MDNTTSGKYKKYDEEYDKIILTKELDTKKQKK